MPSRTAAHYRWHPDCLLHFDESNWYLAMVEDVTLAERVAETVHHSGYGPQSEVKLCANNHGLRYQIPVTVGSQGKDSTVSRTVGPSRTTRTRDLAFAEGLVDDPAQRAMPQWLRTRVPEEPICLAMDQDTGDTTQQVGEKAAAMRIDIIWIRKGETASRLAVRLANMYCHTTQ
jgi:hypothetical protein